jgi:bleomycin hydrolase
MPEFVALVNNPTFEYNKTYRFEGGRTVFETADMVVLNLPIERLKEYTFKSLLDSQVVWFACDVGLDNFNDSGFFAVGVYDYNTTFGIDFNITKADRINYKDMSPNHAMAITGADTTSTGVPRKWQVENSWGSAKGNSGYWTMYDSWFDEYVLLVMIDRSKLSAEDSGRFDDKPVLIEEWRPFFRALDNLK